MPSHISHMCSSKSILSLSREVFNLAESRFFIIPASMYRPNSAASFTFSPLELKVNFLLSHHKACCIKKKSECDNI